jgi:hypothetical protein
MKIPREIYEAHGKLSACSVKFLDFVKRNPESLKRSNFSDLTTDNPQVTLQPWPTLIDQNIKKEFREAGVKVSNLIKSVPQRFFGSEPTAISRYYEISIYMANTLLNGANREHINDLLARGDFIFSSSGLKCLEYNISANIAGWDMSMWKALYLKNPIISDFLQQYQYKQKMNKNNENVLSILFKHFTTAALDKFPGIGDVLNIAVVTPVIISKETIKYLTEYFVQQTPLPPGKKLNLEIRMIVCSYHDLKVLNHVVYYQGEPVHILVEQYAGVVPPDFVDAVKAGNVIIFNGHLTGLMSNKFNLALLSENRDSDIFTAEEKETIEKYIPWTRKCIRGKTTFAGETIGLERFVYSRQERLVIKPSIGFGGQSVYIGKYMKEAQWQEVVNTALETKKCVVQEYVESFPYLYQAGENGCVPHHAVWGFLVFGPTYAGEWLRILPKQGNSGVVNSHQGAEESVIMEMDE